MTRSDDASARFRGDALESGGVEHTTRADTRLEVVGDHRGADDRERDRRSVPGERSQLDLVADPQPGVAHRQGAEGDLVGSGRLPARCDDRPDGLGAIDRYERLDPELAVVGHDRAAGEAGRGDDVRMARHQRPRLVLGQPGAVVEEPDDGVEVSPIPCRVRRHVTDRHRPGGDGDEYRDRGGDATDRRQDGDAGAAAHPAERHRHAGPDRRWPGHGHAATERAGGCPAHRRDHAGGDDEQHHGGEPDGEHDPVHGEPASPRSSPADADRPERAGTDDSGRSHDHRDRRGDRPPQRCRRRKVSAGGAEGDQRVAIIRLASGLPGHGLGDEEAGDDGRGESHAGGGVRLVPGRLPGRLDQLRVHGVGDVEDPTRQALPQRGDERLGIIVDEAHTHRVATPQHVVAVGR